MVNDQGLNQQIAKFSLEAQMQCQMYCQKAVFDQQTEDEQLTRDSIKALETQCNKLCIKKHFKAFDLHNKLLTGRIFPSFLINEPQNLQE